MSNAKLSKSVMFSCFFAGCLEMYDFVIFGFLASVIQANYLSFLSEFAGNIASLFLFAIGFLFRPLGSVIFGHIGDRYGRKRALVASVSLMGTGSLCLSILPSYQDIGVWSCVLLVLIRVVQGISIGGEYSGAAIYAIEHSDKENIGAVGSTVLAGTTMGVLFATLISEIVKSPSLPEYSWRFAFLIGFGLSIVGYFIRARLGESPLFTKEWETKKEKPLAYGIKSYKKRFVAAILLSAANNANYYFALVYIPSYFSKEIASNINYSPWVLGCFMLFMEPLFGWLSDKWDRNKILVFICLILGVYNIFFLDLLILLSDSLLSIGLIMLGALLVSISVSSVNVFVLQIFPTNCRYSCGAFSYSIGAGIFGGTVPFVCELIQKYIGKEPIYLGIYISLISLLGAFGGIILLKKRQTEESQPALQIS